MSRPGRRTKCTASLLLLLFSLLSGKARAAARAGDYMGINQWVDYWDNEHMLCADTARVASWIRWYTYMMWNSSRKGEFSFSPTLVSPFDFDDWFGKWHAAGLKVDLSLFRPSAYCSSYMSNGNLGRDPGKYPPCGGTRGLEPADYGDYSEWVAQLVARYGSAVPPPEKLLTQDRKAGLGVVDAIEIWNEPNYSQEWGSWRHDSCPRDRGNWCATDVAQYTACLKAAYGRAKEADPGMHVTGGVTGGFDERYFSDIKAGGGLASMDGINVHVYLGREQTTGPGHQPEYEDALRRFCLAVTRWRDANAPGKPVWLTEFGYDAHEEKKRPPTFIGTTLSEQANYLIRSFVIAAEHLDRVFWFIAADEIAGQGKTQFQNCGIVHAYGERNAAAGREEAPGVLPKKAYWYMAMLKREIGGLDYAATLKYDDNGIYACWFRDPGGRGGVIVAWAANAKNRTDSGFKKPGAVLVLPFASPACVLVKPVAGSYTGARTRLKRTGNSVTVNLSETPVFLELY